ncbi:hypothetical protein V8F20_000612 [Naviculisporaceae sp. PSN 640]
MASYNGHLGSGGLGKITKTRAAKVKVVKPILKKLAHSEKNSLDLDRGWEEQSVGQLDGSFADEWNGSYGPRSYSAKDVSFAFPVTARTYGTAGDIKGSATAGTGALVNGGAGGVVGTGGSSHTRSKFQHGRSASQASTGSGPRGAFIHPFQQTPRTATPPLSRSYANSLASFDNGPRDYSPTITENEDDAPNRNHSASQTQHMIHNSNALNHTQPGFPPTNARRPSLASNRTSSFPDINTSVPIPRSNTGRTSAAGTASSSRLAHGSFTASNSDLHLNLSQGGHSPTGSVGGSFPPSIGSPTSSAPVAAMSPLRSSFDAASFPRLRSRSELDSAARAESIRAARRKFEERERAKEEKYDREMIKKRERRDNKEASRIEKEAAARKASITGSETTRSGLSRKSTTTDLTISTGRSGGSRKSTSKRDVSSASFWAPPRSSISGLRRNTEEMPSSEEKIGFAARKYESVPATQAPPAFVGPGVDNVRFEPGPRRSNTAKRKTQGYWQGFVLWFRTKLLRISGR